MKTINQKARGIVQCLVIDAATRKVVKEYKPQKNLILNQGLDNVCSSNFWANQFTNCAVGTGTTATSAQSGVSGSCSATTFTNVGGFDFTAQCAVGDMIKMTSGANSGTEVRVTAVTSATQVSVTPSGTIASGLFEVFKTSQTGLTTEVKRTNNQLTGASNCGTTIVSNVMTLKRTFEFTVETGSVTYEEVGLAPTATVGANLFSRIKITPVSLIAGQLIRVVYSLAITVTPDTLVAKTFNITGWPVAPSSTTDGDERWQLIGLMGVDSATGNTVALGNGNTAMELSSADTYVWLSTVATAPAAFNTTPVNRVTTAAQVTCTLASYTPLSFFRDKTGFFDVGVANRTDWRSMGLGRGTAGVNPPSEGTTFASVFDQTQTKTSDHTLSLTYRFTVGRVLA